MRKILFILLGLLALNIAQAQVAAGGLKLTAFTKPNPMGDLLKEYIDKAWKDFTPEIKDPAASVVANREQIAGYITEHATQGVEFARLYNGTKAMQSMLDYCNTLNVDAVKAITGLNQIMAGVDLRSKEMTHLNPVRNVVKNYFLLRYIMEELPSAAIDGSVMFSTCIPAFEHPRECREYREILELGNDPLTLECLEFLQYPFRYYGYTKELAELRPYVEKLMPESKLKKELMDVYELYYGFRNGLPAADLNLSSYDGRIYSLKDFRGKVLVIDVWASWCGGCIEHLPFFMEVADSYKNRDDIEFITVSIDYKDAEKVWRKAVERIKLTGIKNLIADESTSFRKGYNINGVPRYMIIGKDGNTVTLYAPSPNTAAFRELIDNALNK